MLGNIKSNKTVWIVVGIVMISIITFLTVIFIQKQSQQEQPKEINNLAVSPTTLSDHELEKIADITVKDDLASVEGEFANLVDDSLIQQPVPQDSVLVKDELSQLKDIQNQLKEQKETLVQQHQDVDQLLKLKEEQLVALEQQLKN